MIAALVNLESRTTKVSLNGTTQDVESTNQYLIILLSTLIYWYIVKCQWTRLSIQLGIIVMLYCAIWLTMNIWFMLALYTCTSLPTFMKLGHMFCKIVFLSLLVQINCCYCCCCNVSLHVQHCWLVKLLFSSFSFGGELNVSSHP